MRRTSLPDPEEKRARPAVYTRDGGETLAMNPFYDFVFLNLEGRYDATAVKAMADGLAQPEGRRPQDAHRPDPAARQDGAATARARIRKSWMRRGAIRN